MHETMQSLKSAIQQLFSSTLGGFPSEYRSLERAVQTRLHQLLGGTSKGWQMELNFGGNAFRGRVDLAREDGPDIDLVEVKIIEQYRNRAFGHEFPYLFYKTSPFGTRGCPSAFLEERLKELGRPSTLAELTRLRRSLQRYAPLHRGENSGWIRHADEGTLLHDAVKLMAFSDLHAGKGKRPPRLFQAIFILTDSASANPRWQHVHGEGYLERRLSNLYWRAWDLAAGHGRFEVKSIKGDDLWQARHKGLKVEGTVLPLREVAWERKGEKVRRGITCVLLALEETQKKFRSRFSRSAGIQSPVPKRGEPSFRYGVFDLETRKSAQEVGGWGNASRMEVSVAVLYDSADGKYHVYRGEKIPELIRHLQQLDLVVGFNIKGFDYKVLSGYTDFDFGQLSTCDLLLAAGRRAGLDNFARHTLGANKSADGLQAIGWWREGRMEEIERYCREDVRLTRLLFLHACKGRPLTYRNKNREISKVLLKVKFGNPSHGVHSNILSTPREK